MNGDFVPGDVGMESYRLRDEAQENYDRWLWRLVVQMASVLSALTDGGVDATIIRKMRDGLNEAHRKLTQSRMESARQTAVTEPMPEEKRAEVSADPARPTGVADAVAQSIDMANRHGVKVFDPDSVPVFDGNGDHVPQEVYGHILAGGQRVGKTVPETARDTDHEFDKRKAILWACRALRGEHNGDYGERERLARVLDRLSESLGGE